MQKSLIILLILVLACSSKRSAIGEYNAIEVFCSIEDKQLVQPLIDDFFSLELNLPQPEKLYSVSWHEPHEFSEYSNRHNLMVISLVNPVDETGDRLFERIHDAISSVDSVIAIENMYSLNQVFLGIQSFDAFQLKQQLQNYHNWFFDELNSNAQKTIIAYARSKGENSSLSQHVSDVFDVDIIIQKDFQILQEVSEPPFLWICRGYPYRWISFHEADFDDISSPDETWVLLEILLESTFGSIEITGDFRSSEIVKYESKSIPLLRGNYFHPENDSGGPFFTMFFKKPESGYLLISGFINYPGHEKMALIKQLEAIILDADIGYLKDN